MLQLKEQCGICKRVLNYRLLRRCYRCGKLYCRDCMVPDVSTGDPTRLLCLNCARRTVSPRVSVSKYDGLTRYLCFRGAFTNTVKLSFARMDGILGDNLPMNAYKNEAWWSNVGSSPHARGWLDAGWEVQELSLKEGFAIFHKVRDVPIRKKAYASETKPFTPVHVKPQRSKIPSKTRVSKLYARIKNLERQQKAIPQYRGSFKPRPVSEKRLYRQDKKSD